MTFDLKAIIERKRQMRRRLAALPIAEKLRLLDALREREMTIRNAAEARHVRRRTAQIAAISKP
jgi:hypothetical protein